MVCALQKYVWAPCVQDHAMDSSRTSNRGKTVENPHWWNTLGRLAEVVALARVYTSQQDELLVRFDSKSKYEFESWWILMVKFMHRSIQTQCRFTNMPHKFQLSRTRRCRWLAVGNTMFDQWNIHHISELIVHWRSLKAYTRKISENQRT